MPFDSLTFLVLFLPASMIIYYLFPPKLRNGCLTVFSLAFLLVGDFPYALVLLGSGLLDWFAGRKIAQNPGSTHAKRWLMAGLAKSGVILLSLKQYVFLPEVFYAKYPALNLLIPLGLAVCFFKSVSYLADVFSGAAAPQRSPFGLLLYLFFYPALPFGPAVRYRDFLPYMDPKKRRTEPGLILNGLWSLAKGLFKIALLSHYLLLLWQTVISGMDGGTGTLTAVSALLCAAFGVYFLWSGSQDFALGLSGLYGFRFLKPDDYPLMATGLPELVRRADRHLALWLETYVYSPRFAGDNRLMRGIVHLILLLAFRSFFRCDPAMLAVWAGGILLILLLERFLYRPVLAKTWKGFRILYVWVILLFCMMLFLLPSYADICAFSALLFRYGQFSSLDALLEGLLRPLLIFGVMGALLGFSGSLQKLARKTLYLPVRGAPWLLLPCSVLLLICSFVFL